MTSTRKITTRAPFLVAGRWKWVTWQHDHANSHAAVHEKARELGALAWDHGQTAHDIYGILGPGRGGML